MAKIMEESARFGPASVSSNHEKVSFPLAVCVVPKFAALIPERPNCSTLT